MCGIAGAIRSSAPTAAGWVNHINAVQTHRGPDDSVMVAVGRSVLGNTRLAIQEPTPAGNQPFYSQDGRYVAVFNGELYNYRELIRDHGLQVASRCDGAVIVELWSRYGREALRLLQGMYGIAVVDTATDHVTLARDPFGIKPLYWRPMPEGGVAFASEVRSLASLHPRPTVSARAVSRFLYLGALAADESPFAGVHIVPPNTSLTFGAAVHPEATMIDPNYLLGTAGHGGPEMTPCELGDLFTASVDLHLRSDVPTALLLSAGIDSSAIAAVAARLGQRLHCLTVIGGGCADETALAAETARHYGHFHEPVKACLSQQDVSGFFAHMQRPTVDGLNTYLVAKAVREAGFKVALSGLGGDEALAGYSHARLLRLLRPLCAWRRLPNVVSIVALAMAKRAIPRLSSPKLVRLLARDGPATAWELSELQRELFPADVVQQLCGVDPRDLPGTVAPEGWTSDRSSRSLAMAELVLYMQSMLLPDADAFSMAWSIELRVPFVDRPFFSAALQLAETEGASFGKRTLIRALGDSYLTELARRRKTGFAVPMRAWMNDGTLDVFLDQAVQDTAPVWEFLDVQLGRRLLARRGSPRWSESWSICVLNSWLTSL